MIICDYLTIYFALSLIYLIAVLAISVLHVATVELMHVSKMPWPRRKMQEEKFKAGSSARLISKSVIV